MHPDFNPRPSNLLFRRIAWMGLGIWISMSACTAVSAQQGDDLFSKISMSSVVSDRAPAQSTGSKASLVHDIGSLGAALQAEKLAVRLRSRDVLLAAASLLPDAMQSNAEAKNLDAVSVRVNAESKVIELLLTLPTKGTVDGKDLLAFHRALAETPGISLSLSGTEVSLSSVIGNRDVTAKEIRILGGELVEAALNIASSGVDSSGGATDKDAVDVAQVAPVEATPSSAAKTAPPQPATTVDLSGTWSSRISDSDAWAVRFESEQRFVMVHTRNGANTVSKGTYEIRSDKLILSESSGVTLAGSLQMKGADTFVWSLGGANGSAATKLTFGKHAAK